MESFDELGSKFWDDAAALMLVFAASQWWLSSAGFHLAVFAVVFGVYLAAAARGCSSAAGGVALSLSGVLLVASQAESLRGLVGGVFALWMVVFVLVSALVCVDDPETEEENPW